MFCIGVLQAVGITVLISFYNVYLRIAVQEWQVEPVVFTALCLMISAFILSLAAGPGRLVKETLKSPSTWLYSFVLIGTYVVDVYIMHYISATEASFFSRLTIPISLLIAWLCFNRKPELSDVVGVAMVLVGILWLVMLQPANILPALLLVTCLSALFQTLQFVIAENHKEAVVASTQGTIRDKARVVGFVTFISSALFLLLALGVSFLEYVHIPKPRILAFIPELSTFIHPATVWAALFYGVLVLPFVRYLKWAGTYNLKAENMLLFLAFIPFVTMGLERLAGIFITISSNTFVFSGNRGAYLLVIALLMTLGAGLTTFMRVKRQLKTSLKVQSLRAAIKDAFTPPTSLTIHHAANAMDDYEIICATLEHTKADKAQAAALLEIPEDTLYVLHKGKGTLALAPDASTQMTRRFRNHVANRDPLTGLYNRGGFLTEAKKLLQEVETATLVFIDLNKFKPVNDTYGHAAGDAVLKKLGTRLQKAFADRAEITRLGGDEFCVLFTKPEDITNTLHALIEKPISVAGIAEKIHVSASIGVAQFPEQAQTAEDLIAFADKAMYKDKESR